MRIIRGELRYADFLASCVSAVEEVPQLRILNESIENSRLARKSNVEVVELQINLTLN